MNNDKKTSIVYDHYGNPLEVTAEQLKNMKALDPNTTPPSPQNDKPHPQVVYMSRPLEPVKPHISDEVKAKHDEAVVVYPELNLSEGEYVISAIKRHPIGLFSIWGVVGIGAVFLTATILYIVSGGLTDVFGSSNGEQQWLSLILLSVIVLLFLGGMIATIVYEANRFYLTNESVIQHIQTGLFTKKQQTISLGNIEDASFTQHGVLQAILHYGSLRLSTEGDETTYRFSFVSNPDRQIAILNDAVESFKNGRPVDVDDM